MSKVVTVLGAAGIGAGLMYLFDPNLGRRRRSILRDRANSIASTAQSTYDKKSRHLRNRAYGMRAEARSVYQGINENEPVTDQVIQARVKSRLGHAIGHPGAINVTVQDGRVILQGAALSQELNNLLMAVRSTPGVKDVENKLDVHEQADNIAALEGEGRRRESIRTSLQGDWPPAARVFAGAAAGIFALYGMRNRGVMGHAAKLASASLMARAGINAELSKMVGAIVR